MHLGGHSFSQIWQATQRMPASQSAPSYTRKGKTRAASAVGIRCSGYSTVVSRSAETKLPKKFLAVSAIPFRIPSPSNAPSKFSYQQLPVHFSQDNIHAAKDQYDIGDILPQAHVFQNGQVDEAGRAYAIAIGIRTFDNGRKK